MGQTAQELPRYRNMMPLARPPGSRFARKPRLVNSIEDDRQSVVAGLVGQTNVAAVLLLIPAIERTDTSSRQLTLLRRTIGSHAEHDRAAPRIDVAGRLVTKLYARSD